MSVARRQRGFSLIDLLTACTVTAILAGVGLPSYQGQVVKARRGDAVAALMRLQQAQERFHAANGLYGPDLATLRLPTASDQGLYTLALQATDDGFRATATAVPGKTQAGDAECAVLTLDVRAGFASVGPGPRCWNR